MPTDAASQVISGLLTNGIDLIDDVSRRTREEHFTDPVLRSLFRTVLSYRSISGGVLPPEAIEAVTDGADAGTAAHIRETYAALRAAPLASDVARYAAHKLAGEHEKRLTQIALQESSAIATGSITEESTGRVWSGPTDAREWAAQRIGEINTEVAVSDAPAADVLREGQSMLEDFLRARAEDKARRPRTGIDAFDELVGGLGKGLIMVAAPSGFGKAMTLDSLVLTPTGFRRMGDLCIGDPLVDPRGAASRVIGIYPQGERDVYRVTFSDGTTCEADGDHLWETTYWSKPHLRTEIIKTTELLRRKSTAVPYMEVAPDLGSAELPLDPYVLGALLGDGYLMKGTPQFTCADLGIIEEIERHLPAGASVHRVNSARPSNASNYLINGVTKIVDALGIRSGCERKAVPQRYKNATAAVRLAVLQGLFDTDGSVVAGGGAAFDSVSRQLRDDVVWLARSLGFRVSDNGPEGTAHKYFNVQHQEWRESLPRFRAYVSAQRPDLPVLFRLPRKAERAVRSFSGKRIRNARTVSSVEFVRRAPVQCIAVSAPSHLYVTDDFIVTHNTQWCVNLAYHASQNQGLHVYFATSETVRSTVRARLVARHSRHEKFGDLREQFHLPHGLDSQKIDRGTLEESTIPFLARVAVDWGAQGSTSSDGTCYVAQMPHGQTMSGLHAEINARARVVIPDLVVIDYIALMSSMKRHASTREELSAIVKEAAHFSVDFRKGEGVPTVSPWQLNRESQKEMTRTGQLDTSGLAETAEAVNSAHLVVALAPDGARDGRHAGMKINVLKNRDGQVLLGEQGIPITVDYATSYFAQRVGAGTDPFGAEANGGFSDEQVLQLMPGGF